MKGTVTLEIDGFQAEIPWDGLPYVVSVGRPEEVKVLEVRVLDIAQASGRAPLPPTWENTLTFREEVLRMLDKPPRHITTQDVKDAFPEVSHDKVRETLVLLEREGLAMRVRMKGHRPGRAHEHWYRV